MHDAGKIIGGLAVFLVLATSPIWYNLASSSPADVPALDGPPGGATQCVESKEYMRAYHMDLLNDWRDVVVRTGSRDYVSTRDGRTYDMSLSRTCMEQCHTNKSQFCDRCHTYLAVSPYCWDCHVEPKEAQ
jgi:hypothetical protein